MSSLMSIITLQQFLSKADAYLIGQLQELCRLKQRLSNASNPDNWITYEPQTLSKAGASGAGMPGAGAPGSPGSMGCAPPGIPGIC